MSLSVIELKKLRQQLRTQRRQLNKFQQKQAEAALLHHLIQHPQFKHSQKIGLYLDAFGEIQTHQIIQRCFDLGKTVYLPQISTMMFGLSWVKVSQQQWKTRRFSLHQLGMLEPKQRGCRVQQLDLLILPLLACDEHGTRLGMGGGFYDRALQYAPKHPYRLGIAHAFQYLNQPLIRQTWDQPLHALCTPKQSYLFKN
ncbi:5-formyltetrahydrofolate cyclo-ligase [Acinetobacter sp. MD2]|uniref:5-formyltetrahydrofolate cyclo-ligase n=1 Tax=Acinetobacter sp. MD2 TaxID=2600066 RepID=UPI002D1F58C4|nr:5-formyltetrahydrofolate cyclo-ligase [Acinetobacter sp. MD2]MEB3767710.1 5-formyltetrahydrofolate cyclo-ligase [Acinetobacter sp. MD2]